VGLDIPSWLQVSEIESFLSLYKVSAASALFLAPIDNPLGRPPNLPLALAASRPAKVLIRIMSLSN